MSPSKKLLFRLPSLNTLTSNLLEPEKSLSTSSVSSSATTNTTCTTNSSPTQQPPTHHHPSGAGFRNPWPSALSSQSNLSHIINNGIPIELAKHVKDSDVKPLKTLPADLKLYYLLDDDGHPNRRRSGSKLVSTWLGHAGYLVQLPLLTSSSQYPNPKRPFRLLFDPIFSLRAGPTQWAGPKRIQPSPCHIEQIPAVDVCLISHSHYDHLDFETIKELHKRQPQITYYVPLGLKAWFDSVPVPAEQVVELDWWDASCPLNSFVTITCVPAQHSSGRSLLDQNSTLWCGWVVEQQNCQFSKAAPDLLNCLKTKSSGIATSTVGPVLGSGDNENLSNSYSSTRCSVYFAGDTGYRSPQNRDLICPAFKEIGQKFGPIDFSMIPIWRGGTLSFISWAGLRLADPNLLAAHHASPEDALRIHMDVKSRHSVGIHHSCFVGSEVESIECLAELEKWKKSYKVTGFEGEGGFGVVNVGQTLEVDI